MMSKNTKFLVLCAKHNKAAMGSLLCALCLISANRVHTQCNECGRKEVSRSPQQILFFCFLFFLGATLPRLETIL